MSHYKRELQKFVPRDVEIISVSSAKMAVDSFRLNLLPIWLAEISFSGGPHLLLINGQTGAAASDLFIFPNETEELNQYCPAYWDKIGKHPDGR
jgi:hypothetical protein